MKIIYEYEHAISGELISGEIKVKCFCPGVVNGHKRKIGRLGKVVKWEYWK